MSEVRLTIDGLSVLVEENTRILDAARLRKIDIPTLCYEPYLRPLSACRICLVEDKKSNRLLPACSHLVEQDMEILTKSPRVEKSRVLLLELLLANHPLDCLTCERTGSCKLQEYCYQYGVKESPYEGEKRAVPLDEDNPFFLRDYNKCILCGKCQQVCHEVLNVGAIDSIHRGFATLISTPYELPLPQTSCVFCGMCIEVCPVDALTPKSRKGKGRSYDLKKTRSTCVYCGVGCQLDFLTKDNTIVDVSVPYVLPNLAQACVKGKFGWDFVQHTERLKTPLLRKDGVLTPVSMEEALDFAATELKKHLEKGPSFLGGLSSAKCTNEENYLFQKLFRSVLQTNNIDHCARLCHASSVSGLSLALGSAAMTNPIEDITEAHTIFVIGSNTTEAHPVIGYRVKAAAKKGTKLIVADPRRIDLVDFADVWLQHRPGTDVALVNGLLHVILEEQLEDRAFIEERTEGFLDLKESVKDYTPSLVAKITGVPAEKLIQAAKLYGEAPLAVILYSMGITQHTTGTDNVLSLANLALLTGNLGKKGAGLNPLRGQNNVQGACDMGALPNVYPGYQSVLDPSVQEKFQNAYGRIPTTIGLTATEIFEEIEKKNLSALYVMGENPVLSEPHGDEIRKQLKSLELLIVQDIFLSETAELATVVFPACSFAEKEGTFTNTERRVQKVNPVLEKLPGTETDSWILTQIANRLGASWNYKDSQAIFEEIRSLTPIYAGITYDRLKDAPGLQWPCIHETCTGTPYLHKDTFTRGLGKFHGVGYLAPHEIPCEDYPFLLTTGRRLNHFHTGTMSRRSKGLAEILPEELVELHPLDAKSLGIASNDWIAIKGRRATVEARVQITEKVPKGVVFMSFHFKEAAVNRLTNPKHCPIAKIPEFKVCAVDIEKIETTP